MMIKKVIFVSFLSGLTSSFGLATPFVSTPTLPPDSLTRLVVRNFTSIEGSAWKDASFTLVYADHMTLITTRYNVRIPSPGQESLQTISPYKTHPTKVSGMVSFINADKSYRNILCGEVQNPSGLDTVVLEIHDDLTNKSPGFLCALSSQPNGGGRA